MTQNNTSNTLVSFTSEKLRNPVGDEPLAALDGVNDDAEKFAINCSYAAGNDLCRGRVTHGGNAYFFGDSLTDCCVYGRTTAGLNWADLFAPAIGENYTATSASNYAFGGAVSGNYGTQIDKFTAAGIPVGPKDIASIWIGTNDVWTSSYTATDTYGGVTEGGPFGYQPAVAPLVSYIIGNIQAGINKLKADGFQNIVLLSTYDLGQAGVEPGPAEAALATQYSTALTNAESALYTPGINTYFVNIQNLLQQVQANADSYGFTHTTGYDNCSVNNCLSQPVAVQETYILQDNIHLTAEFDTLVASDAAAVVNAGQTVQVPEPASAALLLAGLAGGGIVRRKRKH